MHKSARMSAEDWRAVLRVVGECREIGDDRHAWRSHLAAQLAHRVGGDICFFGEFEGCDSLRPKDLGVIDWGWHNGFDRTPWLAMVDEFQRGNCAPQTVIAYLGRLRDEDGICLARSEIQPDSDWIGSAESQISTAMGTDHSLFCFHSIPGAVRAHSVLQFHRAITRRNFSGRDLAVVREAHAALAPLIGGPLARFADPSAAELPNRMRRVLACLLDGDGDKQVAARLRLSVHTVNEYTKAIFRHFGVRSRNELLARWVRRGWVRSPSWGED